jgi:putative methyltransferase (TIGR04325 family)
LAETYKTFDEAAATCGPGYNDPGLAASVLERSQAIFDNPPDLDPESALLYFALAYTAGQISHRPLCIADVGGEFGLHARICQARFPQWTQKWAIIENSTFAQAGAAAETDSIRIFADIDAARLWLGRIDLLFSSGAVQYLRDPIQSIKAAVETNAPIQFWQRLAIASGKRAVVVQVSLLSDNAHGPLPEGFVNREIRYPRTFLTETEFLNCFAERYRTVVKIPGSRTSPDGLARLGGSFLFESRQRNTGERST